MPIQPGHSPMARYNEYHSRRHKKLDRIRWGPIAAYASAFLTIYGLVMTSKSNQLKLIPKCAKIVNFVI